MADSPTSGHYVPLEGRAAEVARAFNAWTPDQKDREIMRLTTALHWIAESAGPNGDRGTSGDGQARCIQIAREAINHGK